MGDKVSFDCLKFFFFAELALEIETGHKQAIKQVFLMRLSLKNLLLYDNFFGVKA
jgi:hypothetical protein